MKITHLSSVVSAAALLFPGFAQGGPVDYKTGFEAPQFRNGSFGTGRALSTQSPQWSLFADKDGVDLANEVKVETGVARGGTQALVVNAEASNTIASGVSSSFENFEPFVTIQADVMFSSSDAHAGWQFAAGDASARGGFVGGFFIPPETGRLTLITPGVAWTGPIVARDVWTHYTLIFDINAQTYDLLIDNKPGVTKVPFKTNASRVRVFQFHTWGRGNDRAFFDNYSYYAADKRAANPPAPMPAAAR